MKKLISILLVLALPVVLLASDYGRMVDVSGLGVTKTFHNKSNGAIDYIHDHVNSKDIVYGNNNKPSYVILASDGVREVDASGNAAIELTYNYTDGRLTSTVNQYSEVTSYAYGSRMTGTTNHNGELITSYSYNAHGQISSITDERNQDASDPTRTTSYNYNGYILESTNGFDGNGNPITTYFDSGWRTHSVSDETGQTVATFDYNGIGTLVTSKAYDIVTGAYNETTFYDDHSRPDKTIDYAGNIAREIVWNGARMAQQISYPGGAAGSHAYVTTYNEFREAENTYIMNGSDYGATAEGAINEGGVDQTAYDPWTVGELVETDLDGDGVTELVLLVDPNEAGNSFYSMNPEALTGETKKADDGRLMFMVGCNEEATRSELSSLVGKKINIMWQYYSKTSDAGSGGFGWIHLAGTSDWRVDVHLRSDNEDKVEQWGGDWDRSKQWCVVGDGDTPSEIVRDANGIVDTSKAKKLETVEDFLKEAAKYGIDINVSNNTISLKDAIAQGLIDGAGVAELVEHFGLEPVKGAVGEDLFVVNDNLDDFSSWSSPSVPGINE